MKKLGIGLVLAVMMSVLGLEQVNMPDQRLSVDQGHYVGRGSVAGEHADELLKRKKRGSRCTAAFPIIKTVWWKAA